MPHDIYRHNGQVCRIQNMESNLINLLAPGRCSNDLKNIMLKLNTQSSSSVTCCGIALMWMPKNINNGKAKFLQIMAWYCQATSHYLSQCWLRSMTPYGITMPQSSNLLASWSAASWSSGRVQDSGLGSRSSSEFNTLLVRLLVVPLS